jgi:hypothetical protein
VADDLDLAQAHERRGYLGCGAGRVAHSGPQTPTSVNHAKPSHGTFVNTGLRALGHYDLLFDADGGYLGLRAAAD